MALSLSPKQAKKLGEKALDLANLALAVLTFGSIISERGFELWIFLTGLFVYAIVNLVGITLIGRSE